MPSPGKCWYHIILNTRGTWFPGDPRGFRTRKHHLHSSGDYKNPPPPGEHAGLNRYIQARSASPITFTKPSREYVGRAFIEKINAQNHGVLAICIGTNHAHILVELPDDRAAVKKLVGQWKQAASHRIRDEIPGKVWASGCDPLPIRDQAHQRKTYHYILRHRREGAWVWSYRDEG